MAKKRYFLNEEKTQSLELKWTLGWKETYVFFNGQQIGHVMREQLLSGWESTLPDGRQLQLKLDKGFFTTLVSRIDGKHIKGSMGDPAYQLRQIFYLLLVLGLINITVGLIFHFGNVQLKEFEGIGIINALLGLIQIVLGYTITKGSMPSLVMATILMGADLIFTAMYAAQRFQTGIYMKLFFLIFIVRGYKYMKEFRKENMM